MKLPKEIDQYLWNTGHQYGEWLIPSQTVDGVDRTNANHIDTAAYCAPIFGWNSCKIIADTAALLGHKADEQYYTGDCLQNEDRHPKRSDRRGRKNAV